MGQGLSQGTLVPGRPGTETRIFFLQIFSDSVQSPEGLVGVRWAKNETPGPSLGSQHVAGGGRSTRSPSLPPPLTS